MGGVGRWVSAHAGAMTAIAVLIAFVTASSVARCCAIHAPAEEEELSPETIADEGLPSEAKALRKSYSDTTLEALGMLTANVWVDGQGTSVATFTGRPICVRTRGDESWTAYVVMASSRKALTTDGSTSTVTTLCMETPEWTEIATLTVPSAAADGGYATFQCPSLCGGSELALSPHPQGAHTRRPIG